MLPLAKGMDNPIQQTGEDWFKSLGEATQKSMLGDPKYTAWKDGKFEFSQLSKTYEDDIFGTMRGESSLKDILGDKAKDYYSYEYQRPPNPLDRRFVEIKQEIKQETERTKPIEKIEKLNAWGETEEYARKRAEEDWG